MIGQVISHYKILEEIGRGGMGVVYRAEDTKLKRTVALKFLPMDLTRDQEARERFVQEAQAASALEHHNICTIHEIDQTVDGQLFICMSHYRGQTLKKMLETGPLAVEQTVDVALQIAQGLAKAHKHGIVHRDLKPCNLVMTDDGMVKIIDFGLAKLLGSKDTTRTVSTMGTIAYMSPEQILGEAVDRRTDIWSLGAVLYEMLTAQLPFKGETDPPVIYSILNEEPKPPMSLRPNLPISLVRIVEKALQKDCSERYQQMEEVIADLRSLGGDSRPLATLRLAKKVFRKRPGGFVLTGIALIAALLIAIVFLIEPEKRTASQLERIPIAVVDVVNETKEDELNGLSGMLITSLEQSRRLSVLTRSRMFDLLKKSGKHDVQYIDESLGREICKKSDVQILLKPTVRKLGKLYSVELQAIDPHKNEFLFAARESGEGQESILAMIDALSERTRIELNETSTDIQSSSRKVADVTTINIEAYRHYFLGEEFLSQLKMVEAQAEFEQAVALDSTFGLAWYKLSYTNWWRSSTEYLIEAEKAQYTALQKAFAYIDRIPRKERCLLQAQQTMLTVGHPGGYEKAYELLKEEEQLYPDEKEVLFMLGDVKFHLFDYAKSAEYMEEVLHLDPVYQPALQHLVRAYSELGRYNEMLKIAHDFKHINEWEGFYYIGEHHYRLARYDSARVYIENFLSSVSRGSTYNRAIAFLAMTYERFAELGKAFEYARLSEPNYDLYNLAGQGFVKQKDYPQAERAFLEGYERCAHEERAYWNLVHFLPFRGKYRQALKTFDEMLAFYGEADTLRFVDIQIYKALYCLWGSNDRAKARYELDKALEFENHVPYWKNVAFLYLASGDLETAAQIAMEKESPEKRELIGIWLHCARQECLDAEAIADTLISGLPEHERIWASFPIAECQFEAGRLEKAKATLLKLQSYTDMAGGFLAVFYPKSVYLLGRIYEEQEEQARAIQSYQNLLELWKDADPDLPELIDTRKRLAKLSGA